MQSNNLLNANKIEATIEKLSLRIEDRFPDSSLGKTCQDFLAFTKKSNKNIAWIDEPNLLVNAISYSIIFSSLIAIIYSCTLINFGLKNTFKDVIAVFETSINNIVLIGAAYFFLFTLENRLKRIKAIKFLNKIKNFAHIIDMHQLTKDPLIADFKESSTPNSPTRGLSKFELYRYLDYCCEFLSLTGKVAALYSQSLPDPVVERASNEIETLCTNMSSKIWQKLIILHGLD